ncbi:hypothetical protein [Stenotrophomonas sp. S39]|uniref:hypothetical protein n=1 Tax=Stenotrophomonas sp. S39 TaxID=2767451 RepID=UPI00190C2792|nr:hypothetical protein [Stenotrophomonas sp. S39]MBK0056497.1 hypothetical protein [Stenotrophomonas sp. S39]
MNARFAHSGVPMKHTAALRLFQPGMVLFDPQVLDAFLRQHLAPGEAPFSRFVDDPAVGDAATRAGAVFPMYPIKEDDYAVFVEPSPIPEGATRCFSHPGAPLRVDSGVLIAADLHALMAWDADLFLNYRQRLQERLPNSDYLDVAPGCYDVVIHGYIDLPQPHPPQGYGLQLRPVAELSAMRVADDFDFALPIAPPRA